MKTAAQLLLGETLEGGWRVVEYLDLQNVTSGGTFSESYVVENASGHRAFLKVLDYERVLTHAEDPAARLNELTSAYLYERDLLTRCRDRRLDRIVMPVGDGTLRIKGEVVQYLILELGQGDLRVQASKLKKFDLALTIRSLHHVATGLNQLHGVNIAHQDLKPSNVVVFERDTFKLADLGSAASLGATAPHEHKMLVGDPAYAPPELLYKYVDPNWHRRRFGCDAYLLGSMVVFCFSGSGLTASMRPFVDPAHVWGTWSGAYSDVVPHLRDALERVLSSLSAALDDSIRDTMVTIVRELCDPDPALRGDPHARASIVAQYRLDKYVSRFDLLARRAELALIRQRP